MKKLLAYILLICTFFLLQQGIFQNSTTAHISFFSLNASKKQFTYYYYNTTPLPTHVKGCCVMPPNFSFCDNNTNNNNEIVWCQNRPLTWCDFEGEVPQNTHEQIFSAISALYLDCRCGFFNDNWNYSVQAKFVKNESFAKKDIVSTKLLKHEQRHFDLTEVYARKMRKKLQKTTEQKILQDSSDIRKTINKIENEHQNNQLLYDYQTQHGLNLEAQLHWDSIITTSLNELKEYTCNTYTCN